MSSAVSTGRDAVPVSDFGGFLRYLRRRARMTQRELGLRVGYSEGHVCRLEQNRRVPELSVLAALFVPALGLAHDPDAAGRLMELARQARADGDEPPGPSIAPDGVNRTIPAAPAHVVDRRDVLAGLDGLLTTEPIVVIRGLAGTGKTTLAAAYARDRTAHETVCWITVTPGVTASEDALVRQLARQLAHDRGGLTVLVDPADGRPHLPLDRQIDLLVAAVAERPTLVCLDNANAVAGPDVLAMLGHVTAMAGSRLLLTSKTSVDLPGAVTCRLSGLDIDQSLDLIRRLDPDMPAELAARLAERTAGNPMLLRLALGQARQPGTDREHLVASLATNPEIGDYLVHTTLGRLGTAAEHLVSLLSVFRHPVDLHDAALAEQAQVVDGGDDLLDAIGELRHRQLVDDPSVAALHPLVRDHTYARLVGDLPRRRRLHRVAAIWSEHARDDVLEAAWHFSQADADGRAIEVMTDRVRTLIGRGQALAAGDLATELRDRLRRRPAGGEPLRRAHVLVGDLLVNTARADDAESAYRTALAASGSPALRATVARRLAESMLHRGQVPEALKLCQNAADRLDAQDVLLHAELAATQAQARLQLSEYDEALRLGHAALDLAARITTIAPEPADEVAAHAGFTVGVVLRMQSRHATADAALRAAADRARRVGLHHLAGRCLFNIGALWMEQGDLVESLRVWESVAVTMRATGDNYGLARVLHAMAAVRHYRGEPAEDLALCEQAGALKRQHGDAQGMANVDLGRALALRTLDRVDEALAVLHGILAGPMSHTEPSARVHYLDAYGTTLLVAGRTDDALDPLREALDLAERTGGLYERVTRQHLALAELAAGDPERAIELADEELPGKGSLLELQLDARLLRAAVALARHDRAGVAAAADELARWVDATGFLLHRTTPAALNTAAADPPPPRDIPRLIWVTGPRKGR